MWTDLEVPIRRLDMDEILRQIISRSVGWRKQLGMFWWMFHETQIPVTLGLFILAILISLRPCQSLPASVPI